MKNILIVIIAFYCFSSLVHGQYKKWVNYTNGDRITALLEEDNIIWVGTTGGLVKINIESGNTTYFNSGNSGLHHNYISDLAIDANGTKWIVTDPFALASFDDSDWTVHGNPNNGTLQWGPSSIAIDNNGTIWTTSHLGLASFNGDLWTVYNHTNSGLPDGWLTSIAIDDNDVKWIGTYDSGLVYFDDTSWEVFNNNNSGIPSNNINSITIDKYGAKWIGFNKRLICVYSDSNWTTYQWHLPSNCRIHDITIGDDDLKWIATSHGLVSFDGMNWQTYDQQNSGIPDRSVSTTVIDMHGTIWVGTEDQGLVSYDNFNWLTHNTSGSGLLENGVCEVSIDHEGLMWFGVGVERHLGARNARLVSFNNNSFTVHNDGGPGQEINDVLSIAFEENGVKWVGTFDGLLSYDGNNWEKYEVLNYIWCVAIDNDGRKWIGTENYNYGHLLSFDGSNWTVHDGLSDRGVNVLTIESNQTKWVSIATGGLGAYNGNNWLIYDTVNSDIPSNDITAIAIDNNGVKWIGTFQSGLASFDGSKWNMYNKENSELPSNSITAITIDDQGVKWLGTARHGLVSFDGTHATTYNIYNSGISGYYVKSIAIDSNDTKWISCYEGYLIGFNENGLPQAIVEQNIKDTDITIYPNPTSGIAKITSKDFIIDAICIYKISGQKVKSVPISSNFINVEDIPSGNYIIGIRSNNIWIHKKLVIYR